MNLKNLSIPALLVFALLFPAGSGCKMHSADKRTSPNLMSFSDCSRLEQRLKDNLKEEMKRSLLSYNDMYVYAPMPAGTVPAPGAPEGVGAFTDAAGPKEGVDYSGTNNQEAGADEADFVKTDGHSVFIVNSTSLFVLPVARFGQIEKGDAIALEGAPFEILLYKGPDGAASLAMVFSLLYSYDLKQDHPLYQHIVTGRYVAGGQLYPAFRSCSITKLTLLNLTAAPGGKVIRELYCEGTYQTARLIGGTAHLALYAWPELAGLKYWPELPEAYYAAVTEAARKVLWDIHDTLSQGRKWRFLPRFGI